LKKGQAPTAEVDAQEQVVEAAVVMEAEVDVAVDVVDVVVVIKKKL
jgi:hypothetical protein